MEPLAADHAQDPPFPLGTEGRHALREREQPALSSGAGPIGRLKHVAQRVRRTLPQGQTLPEAAWRRRHKAMLWLLWANAVALPLYAIARGYGLPHAVAEGAAPAALGVLAMFGNRRFRSAMVSLGLLTCPALLVHLAGGVIEAHFYFFVMIVVLTLYEDWFPFLLAVAYVVLHHGAVGALDTTAVYNHPGALAQPWKWAAIHGLFVTSAGIACVVSWRLNEDVRAELGWAERAQRANQAKSEFLSRVSHELRTPLNAILGFAQLLEMDDLDRRQRENLEQILKGGGHLLMLLNEVLEISRIESGEVRISVEPVNVNSVTREAIALISPLAAERGVTLQADPSQLDRYAAADYQRLKQVLLNLLSNGVKYNDAGGTVSVSVDEAENGRLRILVQDDGGGIAAEELPKLFNPFERLGAEQTTVEGTGLGLALSRGLVEAMAGTISVESKLGEGTRFCVELKVAEAPAVLEKSQAPALAGERRDNGSDAGYSVLCIEDNPSNLKLVERVLSHRPDIHLLTAMQGRLGLDLARQHHPDLVLLDINLPDKPGDVVLEELRADSRTSGIPVVVLSADATESQVKRMMALGADAYLTKPLDVKRLLEVLEEAFRDRAPAA